MTDQLMLDANLVIDYQRGRREAVAWFRDLIVPPVMTAVVVGELYAGIRNETEREWLDLLMSELEVIPLTGRIAARGGWFRQEYGQSHGVGFNDAMIAATAESEQRTLATRNVKHFPMLTDLLKPY